MEPIPKDLLVQFDDILKQRNVPLSSHSDYRKWLRYFLDYRAKYSPPDAKTDQVRLFAEKLRSKNQTAKQLEEAADAVSLLFALQQRKDKEPEKQDIGETVLKQTHPELNSPLGEEETGKSENMPITGETRAQNEPGIESSSAASFGPFAPRSRGGNRYDEWRCLRKTESPAWDKVIADLAAEINGLLPKSLCAQNVILSAAKNLAFTI